MVEFAVFDQEVLSHNLFGYCGNESVDTKDVSGHFKLKIGDYRKKHWLAKFLYNFVSVVSEKEKKIAERNLWYLGIKIAIFAIAGTSVGKGKFFTINKKSLSCSIGGLSFSSNGKLGISTSFSLFSTTISTFVFLSSSGLTYGMSVLANTKVGKKKVYYGWKLAITIKYTTLAMAGLLAIICAYFVPALTPLLGKLVATLGSFVTSPVGLKIGATSIVTAMKAFV